MKKKQDKLRMILDCRRSNCHFGVPSNVKLATGDSLARVEVGETVHLQCGSGQRFLHPVYACRVEEVLWPSKDQG